jgi:hypothetical protein
MGAIARKESLLTLQIAVIFIVHQVFFVFFKHSSQAGRSRFQSNAFGVKK